MGGHANIVLRYRVSFWSKEPEVGAGIETDVLLICTGPVGPFGAYYAAFRGLSTAVIDAPRLGAQSRPVLSDVPARRGPGAPVTTGDRCCGRAAGERCARLG